MNLELKDIDKVKKEVIGEIPYEELSPHFEKQYKKQQKNIERPGFRKGKVPMSIIKREYGERIEYMALEDIIDEVFRNFITEKDIHIVGGGAITDMDYKPNEKLTFKVEFEVMPEVVLENYKELELTKYKNVIDDSLVDQEIDYYRRRMATFEMDGQALDDDYLLTLDLQSIDDTGNIIIGDVQKDAKIYLNSPELLPEFRSGLEGIREDEERVLSYKDKDGNDRKIKAICKKVEKVVLPEMDEEFFKKITNNENIKTEEEFRNFMKEELQKSYDYSSEETLKNSVISEMVKLNDVHVPEKFVNVFLNHFLENYKNQQPNQKLPNDFNVEEFKKQNRADAIMHAKWEMIKNKLIETEKIEVTDEDIKKLAADNASKYNIPEDKLLDIYKKDDRLSNTILNNKVIDFLLSNAKIIEKEEIRKAHQHEHDHEHDHSH